MLFLFWIPKAASSDFLFSLRRSCASATAVSAAATPLRDILSFNFAIKHHLGANVNASCPSNAFPGNVSGIQCDGLSSRGATSADSCRSTCCDEPSCLMWQYVDPSKYSGGGCWVGQSDECSRSETPWVGQSRNQTGTSFGPASRTFNDDSWDTVNAPHDFLISGTFNESYGEEHAFLPKNVSW